MMKTKLLLFCLFIQLISVSFSQQSWQEIIYDDSIKSISFLPISYDTIFLGDNTTSAFGVGGVYRSIDSGDSWMYKEFEFGIWGVYSLLRGENGTIYAGTNWGVFKSEDWGENWERIFEIFKNCTSIDELAPDTLFAGFENIFMRSTNGGITWDTCLSLHQNTAISSILVVSESLIYAAATSYTSNDGGLYVSYDLGESWERIGLITYNIQSLALSQNNELYAGCYYIGLLKSMDFGITWDTVLPNQDAVSVIARGNEVFVGCARQSYVTSGIFYSGDNGITWEDRTHNITNKEIKKIAFSDDNYLFSLSRWEGFSQGPPLNRSLNTVVNLADNQLQDIVFNVYPNPASSNINIWISSLNISDNSPFNIRLLNLGGELVYNDSIAITQGEEKFSIDISRLDPGLYILIISTDEYSHSQKILIL